MQNIFDSFEGTSKSDWVDLIHKELKGAAPETLQKFNKIEEISLPSYFHREDKSTDLSDPGIVPFTRGAHSDTNDWMIGSVFRLENEKATNSEMLASLMAGASSLVIHATDDRDIAFETLFAEIGLEFIHTAFYPVTQPQALDFLEFMGDKPGQIVFPRTAEWINSASDNQSIVKPFCVNAYSVQQTGATTWQEIGFALAEGHEYLAAQLEAGTDLEKALNNIHFTFGIGSKYFYEIAKLRAFRTAWSSIVSEYAEGNDFSAPFITAKTGFTNISLKDPYTNLLRQTTEAMSAVIGGADQLVIQPYDWFSTNPNTAFSRRMATNISLLLKEESHLHIVADAAGGSYALENLTAAIAERAWEEFRRIEREGGIDNPAFRVQFSSEIREKATQRLSELKDKKSTLIGINAFPNPQQPDNSWGEVPAGWNGLPAFISEEQYTQYES